MRRKRVTSIPRVYTFTVAGNDDFPLDMLRYDLCYPKSQRDASEMAKTFRQRRGEYRVTLVSSKAPTEERWGSFGWALESVE